MAKIYSLKAGSRLPEGIVALLSRDKVSTGLLSGIGGVSEVTIAYFNRKTKKYEDHTYSEQLELTSLVGNVTVKDRKPFVHMHGTFGRKDMSVIGGHIVSGRASPLLELVVTPTTNRAVRKFDEDLGLYAIYRS